jgi:hypothetical protein
VAIELKVKRNKPSENQKLFIEQVNKAGGVAGVAWSWGQVKEILSVAGIRFD